MADTTHVVMEGNIDCYINKYETSLHCCYCPIRCVYCVHAGDGSICKRRVVRCRFNLRYAAVIVRIKKMKISRMERMLIPENSPNQLPISVTNFSGG